jgi:hypothetical protein
MNVIKLMGGIGNQFFQYAFGRAQKENGIRVTYDLSWMETRTSKHPVYPRPYRLNMFNTDVPANRFKDQHTIEEYKVGFDMSLLKKDGFNFVGYWQYLDYFKDILPILKEEFKLKDTVKTAEFHKYRELIEGCESVAVHVRRGDYLLHRKGHFNTLPFKYYVDIVSRVKGSLFIFSDDIPWCKERFTRDYFDRDITFVQSEDYLEFELMRLCKHQLTTNSTFSWWAGLLNDNPEKIVVCPDHWLGEENSAHLHYPEEWIKVDDYVVY